MKPLQIAACVLSFVSLLLLLIALGSDYWTVGILTSTHVGLWQVCEDGKCVPFGMQVPGYFHATRFFLFMGMFAGAVSFFGLCASFFYTHVGSISLNRLAMWVSFGAGVLTMIALSIFRGMFNDLSIFRDGLWYGWSFGLGWTSFVLFLITGGLSYKPFSTTT